MTIADGVELAIDLHCPYIRGDEHETIFFVGGTEDEEWNEVGRFSEILEQTQEAGLGYTRSSNLPFGQSWNTESSSMLTSCSAWMSKLPGSRFGSTLEIAYANANGNEVTPRTARRFGRDITRAIWQYLS